MNLVELIKYIVLGIVQGFTEPIPVSSSGHLAIFKKLINSNVFNDLNFEIVVNFGSLIAIILFFRKDIIKLIQRILFVHKNKRKKISK